MGILHSLEPYFDLPVLLETFRTKYPKVEFAVRSLLTETIPEQVRSGSVDLSFHAVIKESKWTGMPQDGWRIVIVKRGQRAFKITGLTWIVERTFAWLGRNRRFSKDYEYAVQTHRKP